jgi:hypothetical protein
LAKRAAGATARTLLQGGGVKRTLALLVLLAGCNGGGLRIGDPDGGSVPSDLGAACAAAGDVASCRAIAGCQAVGCPLCGGGMSFLFCIPDGQPYGVLCSDPCEQTSCSEITDATTCNARPDCYSFMSGDLPCDNLMCSDHFERCVDGPPACGTPGTVCNGSCTVLTPMCEKGEAEIYASPDQSCCPVGCTTADRCATGGR